VRPRTASFALGILLGATLATGAMAAGPPFPEPVDGRAVYDEADLLRPGTESALEDRIDAIEARTGAEIVVYTEHNPDISEEENFDNAATLIDEWGIGRAGFDDGLVILVAKNPDPGETRITLFGGSGFVNSYVDEAGLGEILNDELIPHARSGDWDEAMLATLDALDRVVTPETAARLETARILNAGLGLIGGALVLVLTLGYAWRRWRRDGDDPELTDSPSILMAGPPAGMTPPLATVIRDGQATQHSLNTTLVELASTGRISFENLDRVREVKSDDEPDPLLDPAIVIHADAGGDSLPDPQSEAWEAIRDLGGGSGRLTRNSLWRLNDRLSSVRRSLEADAVRLGWLARLPSRSIGRMSSLGGLELLAGIVAIIVSFSLSISGLLLVGGALVIGGVGTLLFGRAMSQRTKTGAYVDAMLTAYRRTLARTLEQARSMREVVDEPTVRTLADTPDKAVVWGIALGLHDEVARVLARSLADRVAAPGSDGAYYPVWLGSSPGSAWADERAALGASGGVIEGGGSIFSGSAIPDFGGMFNALGSVGSTPPSSSSSGSGGGGFGGGGSSGGGGASGSV